MVKVLLPYFNKRLPFHTAEGSRLHILSKNDPCSPPPPLGVSIKYSSTIISILAMVLLSNSNFKSIYIYISLILYPRVGQRHPLIPETLPAPFLKS